MPDRVKAHLEAQGVLRQGLTSTPRLRHCRGCGLAVWAFIDPVWASHIRALDPFPIGRTDEHRAMLAGQATWEWRHRSVTPVERFADPALNIVALAPADTVPVFVAHHCGTRYPPNRVMTVGRGFFPTRLPGPDDPIPF